MKTEGEGQLLRIYIGESDRWEGRPLYEAIVRAAREQGLAGATALRGIEGFGATSRIHTVKVLRLSENLPIVVEIADRPERIAAFMPTVDAMVREGMVTLDKVKILVYRHEGDEPPPAEIRANPRREDLCRRSEEERQRGQDRDLRRRRAQEQREGREIRLAGADLDRERHSVADGMA